MADVAVVLGSASDQDTMEDCFEYLDGFGIEYELKIASAHRTPDEVKEFASNARSNGFRVIIAGAGLAAHLPGVIAAYTTLPVLGVPIDAGSMQGLDALYSIVQMPGGVPVGTVAIGKHGARNSAVLAAQILALSNNEIANRLDEFKANGCRIKKA
ncbi:MAG: 5-(carboxyamino)imidazole ribonucleotide mutase [Candidatus Marinimicrobia bacterium]|nr:5-(carboxyamino)imidazole ribonucleotide mutase [Candidatus Neomarinimicrobiota bacterium]MCF7880223.1 5-(carboxyamino)imidazole ribonucleotide mutase [Candidatus Neomarinimicrobiota bacterium]